MKNKCGFRLKGKEQIFKTAKETYLNVLRVLKKNYCPKLYEILSRDQNTADIGYFVKNPDEVYKRSPSLADKEGNIGKLEEGWYTATILSNKQKEEIIMYACAVSNIKYLDELEVWFEGGNNQYSPTSKEEAKIEWDRLSIEFDRLLKDIS